MLGATLAMGVLLVVGGATPAAAHGGSAEEPPSNYRADITSFDPGVAGVSLRVVEGTSRLELANHSASTVIVMGYDGDQYLRVGPDGVFENENSGAAYINANFSGSGTTPANVDPKATPKWRQISTEQVAVWHDHRTHWMAATEAVVERDPGETHVVNEQWIVPFSIDGRPVQASGTITWVPGPNRALWFLGVAAVTALGVAACCTSRCHVAVVGAATLVLSACAVDATSAWRLSSAPPTDKLAALVLPALAAAAVIVGLVVLRRREQVAVMLLGAGGAALAVLFGWLSLDLLTYSQVPSAFDALVARLTVAGALSGGAILVGALLVQRRQELAFLIRPQPNAKSSRRRPPGAPGAPPVR